MNKILFILGHGENSNGTYDPGAIANGYREADFLRGSLLPYLKKWAKVSTADITFYDKYSAYSNRYLDRVDPKVYDVCELHIDAATVAVRGGHIIIHNDYKPDPQDHALASMIKRFWGCRGGVCFSWRSDLQNVNIARARGINYRLVEYCFITSVEDMNIFKSNLDQIAKATVEAMTGEKLAENTTPPPVVEDKPKEVAQDDWSMRVRKLMTDHRIMSDGGWDQPVTKGMVASWLYTLLVHLDEVRKGIGS